MRRSLHEPSSDARTWYGLIATSMRPARVYGAPHANRAWCAMQRKVGRAQLKPNGTFKTLKSDGDAHLQVVKHGSLVKRVELGEIVNTLRRRARVLQRELLRSALQRNSRDDSIFTTDGDGRAVTRDNFRSAPDLFIVWHEHRLGGHRPSGVDCAMREVFVWR